MLVAVQAVSAFAHDFAAVAGNFAVVHAEMLFTVHHMFAPTEFFVFTQAIVHIQDVFVVVGVVFFVVAQTEYHVFAHAHAEIHQDFVDVHVDVPSTNNAFDFCRRLSDSFFDVS